MGRRRGRDGRARAAGVRRLSRRQVGDSFVGGAIALSPPAALVAAVACAVVSGATSFAWGARAAVFGFPVFQLAFDPVERVIATGWLMAFIGLLFAIDRMRSRRSGRASGASDAARTR